LGGGEAAQKTGSGGVGLLAEKVRFSFLHTGASRVKKNHSGGVIGRDTPLLRL
jgi:hypothetical protein